LTGEKKIKNKKFVSRKRQVSHGGGTFPKGDGLGTKEMLLQAKVNMKRHSVGDTSTGDRLRRQLRVGERGIEFLEEQEGGGINTRAGESFGGKPEGSWRTGGPGKNIIYAVRKRLTFHGTRRKKTSNAKGGAVVGAIRAERVDQRLSGERAWGTRQPRGKNNLSTGKIEGE